MIWSSAERLCTIGTIVNMCHTSHEQGLKCVPHRSEAMGILAPALLHATTAMSMLTA